MAGVSIITKGYSAESGFASGGPFLPYDVPVRTGLIGFHLFGAASAKTLNNFAPDGSQGCTLVGTPTYNSGYVSLASRANASPAYIQTPYAETSEIYLVAVARFTGANDTTANRGVLVSNQASLASGDGVTNMTAPLQIAPNSTTALFATVMRGATDAAAVQAGATLSGLTLGNWGLYTLQVPATGVNTITNETAGLSASAATSALHRPASGLLRIGSSISTGNGGTIDIASFGIWSAIPDSTGRAAIIAALRANAASKSITV